MDIKIDYNKLSKIDFFVLVDESEIKSSIKDNIKSLYNQGLTDLSKNLLQKELINLKLIHGARAFYDFKEYFQRSKILVEDQICIGCQKIVDSLNQQLFLSKKNMDFEKRMLDDKSYQRHPDDHYLDVYSENLRISSEIERFIIIVRESLIPERYHGKYSKLLINEKNTGDNQ
jgi:hypothetical protein